MAMDLKWILSADDKASTVFDKVKASGESASKGIEGAFDGVLKKFDLLKGVATGMATIAAGGMFKKIIDETIAWSSEAVTLSKNLGITVDQASVLNVALGDVYLSKETMLAGSARIAKTLKTEEEAFTRLGVATRDQSGHYRNTVDIMADVNTKLGLLREGTDRNIAGMSIYGKSWQELSGLIKLNNTVMDEAQQKARELGLIVGEEQVAEMKKYKAAINDIEDVTKSLTLRFGNVLLPHLIQVGAFFGKNGPILAETFRYSLLALGKTVTTIGEGLGLLGFQAYSLGLILKSVFTGNFADASNQWKSMMSAGDDYLTRTRAKWADWSSPSITSKAVSGNQLSTDFGNEGEVAKKADDTLKKRLELWKQNAKSILDVEKDRIKALIDIDKQYLAKLKDQHKEQIAELEKLKTAYGSVLDSMAARDQRLAEEKAALLRGAEDSYTRYYRLQAELKTKELAVDDDPNLSAENVAKKLKLYDEMISRAELYRNEALAGNVENVSAEQAEWEFLISKHRLEEKILGLGGEQIKQRQDLAAKAQEAVDLMEKGIAAQQSQLSIVEQMIKNIPDITVKELQIKVTGMDDLYKVTSLINPAANSMVSSSQSQNNKAEKYTNYWGEETTKSGQVINPYGLPTYALGTNYVPRDGYAYLHKGEAVVPAKYNNGSSGNIVNIGDINITLPGVNKVTAAQADELARALLPKIQQYAKRSL